MIVIVCKPRKFDREADEWIAREHAKEIANNKVFKFLPAIPTFNKLYFFYI